MNFEVEDLCYDKAIKLVESGLVKLSPEMNIFNLTDLLIKIEKEKQFKNEKSDLTIDYNDSIESIEEVGILDTVDISVTGDNLFYCNNILTKNSFGLPATVDFMAAIVTNDELVKLNQYLFVQLASRYGDVNYFKRFVVGVDKSKMKSYDTEQSSQDGLSESGQDNISVDQNNIKKFNGFKV